MQDTAYVLVNLSWSKIMQWRVTRPYSRVDCKRGVAIRAEDR